MGKGIFDGLEEKLQPFYEAMVRDLVKQRKRIGGDWGIAQAVFSRTQRAMIVDHWSSARVYTAKNALRKALRSG